MRLSTATFEPLIFSCLFRTTSPRYIAPVRTAQETSLPLLCVLALLWNKVSTELLPSKGCSVVASLLSCCLAMGLHVS
jgi:hypothetical protein